MTHASIELVEAMAGTAPAAGLFSADMAPACGGRLRFNAHTARVVVAFVSGFAGSLEDRETVLCERCLVAMDAAREGRVLR